MKQKIKGNVVNPLPVVLVGTQINNRPNYLVIDISLHSILESTFSLVCLRSAT